MSWTSGDQLSSGSASRKLSSRLICKTLQHLQLKVSESVWSCVGWCWMCVESYWQVWFGMVFSEDLNPFDWICWICSSLSAGRIAADVVRDTESSESAHWRVLRMQSGAKVNETKRDKLGQVRTSEDKWGQVRTSGSGRGTSARDHHDGLWRGWDHYQGPTTNEPQLEIWNLLEA